MDRIYIYEIGNCRITKIIQPDNYGSSLSELLFGNAAQAFARPSDEPEDASPSQRLRLSPRLRSARRLCMPTWF